MSARLAAQRCTTGYEHGLVMQVIWPLGASMVVLAALVGLPVRSIAAIGLALVCGHNLLDGVGPEQFGVWVPEVFGRVPLFFYVLHIALAHLAAGLIALWMGFGTAVLGNIFLNLPDGWGFGLGGVYLAWACLLAVLYPACRWFARIRRRRTAWWLAYL